MSREDYIQILKEELVPAFGCTEPIAIAYCGARARKILGAVPERVEISVSGNIIKNVKSVIVPNTGGLKGIEAAAAAGIIAGREEEKLSVIGSVTERERERIKEYLKTGDFSVRPMEEGDKLDIEIRVFSGEESAAVRISKSHTNIVLEEKNGQVLKARAASASEEERKNQDQECPREKMTVESIFEFAQHVPIKMVEEILDRQISYNYAIAEEGMRGDWGANVGKVLLKMNGDDVRTRARAMAAAGSDARMSGCGLPVVINSGSGNQGITVSVPVIVYAKELNVSRERLCRALLISNLIAVHLKYGIGPLSAFCGAVSAGCAAGCGIAYLLGGGLGEISHTLVNSLAIVSGIICDGAKPSCAGKIASSVDAGILGYYMYCEGQQFYGNEGIVSKGVENTIRNICSLGREGMEGTDKEIIRIMTQCG